MTISKISLYFISIISLSIRLQAQVFDDKELQDRLWDCAFHIYNSERDSSFLKLAKVEREIPNHPAIPLMKAMAILWSSIPIISNDDFQRFESFLRKAIEFAELNEKDMTDPEMVFFAMGAHGLLAEYYADKGWYLKAAGEANEAYALIKKGFVFVEQHKEFLLTTGLYNYFREKYPEQYPIYKPLLWFFRDGNKEKGLQQLVEAANESLFIEVEANVYLSYIFLRYEFKPKKAQEYLLDLCERYPGNLYAKAKYLESIANPEDFSKASLSELNELANNTSPYYQLAGYTFLGYRAEVMEENHFEAERLYTRALKKGEEIPDHGKFFKSFAHLGLGRVLVEKDISRAKNSLRKAVRYAETDQVKQESLELLSNID
ncbi:MAG: hypothetical protein AAF789_02255 [Bacteroidota bacterium]